MTLMDEADRKRFLETLRQDTEFRAAVQRELLAQELLALPQSVALLAASISGLVEHQAEMQRELALIRDDLNALVETTRELFGFVQNVIIEMGEGFAEVRQEFAEFRQEVSGLRQEVSGLRQEVSGLRQEVSGLRQGFIGLDARFDQLGAEIRDLRNPDDQ
jgi:chromosome segregation ATPase